MYTTKNYCEYLKEKEFILDRVSELDIFKQYVEGFKEINQRFKSTLRKDNNPSCVIYINSSNRPMYKDFGIGKLYDCYSYVCDKYNISFKTVLNYIIRDFNLKTNNIPMTNLSSPINEINMVLEPPKKKEITIEERPFEQYDMDYWGTFNLTPSLLHKYGIVPVRYAMIDNNLLCGSTPNYPCYCFKIGEYKKIYRPNNDEGKWYNTIPSTSLFGFKQLEPGGELLIITKSLKDVLVYKSFGYSAIAPQAESIIIEDRIMKELLFRFDKVLVNYDTDLTGMKFSKQLCDKYRIKRFFTPQKDISDSIAKSDIKTIKMWLDNKINEII